MQDAKPMAVCLSKMWVEESVIMPSLKQYGLL
jgi:hypothetical protein